jgi:hypothetical protein
MHNSGLIAKKMDLVNKKREERKKLRGGIMNGEW